MHVHSVRESDLCFKNYSLDFEDSKTLACPEPMKTSPPFLYPTSASLSFSSVRLPVARRAIAASGAKIKIGIGARGNARRSSARR